MDPETAAAPTAAATDPIKTDRYGFILKSRTTSAAQPASPSASSARPGEIDTEPLELKKQRARKENERTEKWRVMIASSSNVYRIVRSREFRRRVRKGIPDALRAYAWTNMLVMISDKDVEWAKELIERAPKALSETESGREALEAIQKDLGRTYPLHAQFVTASGQAELGCVLSGYAAFDPEVGYCQGMSFVAALFLMYLTSPEALCLLKEVMNNRLWSMRDMFKPDMAAVGMRLYQYDAILTSAAPSISKHFKRLGFEPSMYATHWFATVFTYNFPFFLVLRIWDCFLLHGWPIVLGASAAIWRLHKKDILKIQAFEQLFDQLKRILATFPLSRADEFIEDAMYVADNYSTEMSLNRLEKRYFQTKGSTGK